MFVWFGGLWNRKQHWRKSAKISLEIIKCPLKFNVDYKVRPAKLSISKKGVLKCAWKYKVQHLRG